MLGMWWFPGAPDRRAAGILDVSDGDRWKLKLYGAIEVSSDRNDLTESMWVPTIWGRTDDGKMMSLFDVLRTSASVKFPADLTPEEWVFNWYSVGNAHIDPMTTVRKIRIEFDGLSDWTWRTDVSRCYDSESQTVQIPPPWQESFVVQDATVTLTSRWNPSLSMSRIGIEHHASLVVEDTCPANEIFRRWVFPIQGLLEFLALEYVSISDVAAFLCDSTDTVRVSRRAVKPDTTRVKPLSLHNMLVRPRQFLDLGIGPDALFQNWFTLQESHGYNLRIISSLHSAPFLYSDTRMLIASVAIEGYHAVAIGGTVLSKEDYSSRVRSVLDVAPADHQEWLADQLENRNQKSQLRIVSEVLDCADGTARQIEGVWPEFAKFVRDQRNRSVHSRTRSDDLDGLRFEAASRGLLWVLRHLYLVELGIPANDVTNLVAECDQFQQDLGLLQRWHAEVSH